MVINLGSLKVRNVLTSCHRRQQYWYRYYS